MAVYCNVSGVVLNTYTQKVLPNPARHSVQCMVARFRCCHNLEFYLNMQGEKGPGGLAGPRIPT